MEINYIYNEDCLETMKRMPAEYVDGEHKSRNVFEVKVVDGQLVGEDVCFCDKWRALGEKVYVHPSISISHIGKKRYSGSFEDYVRIANNDKPA